MHGIPRTYGRKWKEYPSLEPGEYGATVGNIRYPDPSPEKLLEQLYRICILNLYPLFRLVTSLAISTTSGQLDFPKVISCKHNLNM